ncbi:uncharacterized protein LOC110276866 [Arachis duranensis]|uniref:Uncharacterized protein LOC110276866 n=1 Tax=Arachis duranensis TaxID=130453 RepID=A0A6P5MX00_ARADU|nr:uncharacterized protein LOC110276866 [Arachis duranensis]
MCRENGQKNISISRAVTAWKLVLAGMNKGMNADTIVKGKSFFDGDEDHHEKDVGRRWGQPTENGRRGNLGGSQHERIRSPPRQPEKRPFGGTGSDRARIIQELRHRVQNLERKVAVRERRQSTPSLEHSRPSQRREGSPRSSHSRRTPSPESEPKSQEESREAPRRWREPLVYTRTHREGSRERPRRNRSRGEDGGERARRSQQPVIMGVTPFHHSILEVRLSKHFDKPTNMRYDGTQDPQEHLTTFEAKMNLEGVGDEVRCRAFQVTLASLAIRWFNGLPQASITTFGDITQAFLSQFTTRIVKAKHPINLLGITQRTRKPTRKYPDRFNDECLEIDDLTDSVAKVSQVVTANKRQPTYNQPRQYSSRERLEEHSKDGVPTKNSRPFPRVGKFTNYTPLAAPIVEVYQQIADKGILSKPRPLKDRTGGNKSLYCDYHKGFGHKTQDCFDLKDALEHAIRDGKLAELSHLIREPRRRDRDRPEDKDRVVRQKREPEEDSKQGLTVVNVVVERDAAPRSRSACRKDAKVLAVSSSRTTPSPGKVPLISFGPKNQWIEGMQENPPMVITARVGTGLVKRILVDIGTDSNIIFRNVFDALDLRDADLKTHEHGVVGLGDHFIKSDGIISLPVSIGRGPVRRTVMPEFVVLRDSTAYNIIMGRETINELGAIIYTKLLVMKFVSDNGLIGSIQGDLEKAVACDNASLSLRKKSKEAAGVFLADLDARIEDKPRPEPEGDLEKIRIGYSEAKFTFVNRNLPYEVKEPLVEVIWKNGDLFAWTPADMPGIDPELMSHHLAMRADAKLAAQRRRKMSQERADEVARQTADLLQAEFIQE